MRGESKRERDSGNELSRKTGQQRLFASQTFNQLTLNCHNFAHTATAGGGGSWNESNSIETCSDLACCKLNTHTLASMTSRPALRFYRGRYEHVSKLLLLPLLLIDMFCTVTSAKEDNTKLSFGVARPFVFEHSSHSKGPCTSSRQPSEEQAFSLSEDPRQTDFE